MSQPSAHIAAEPLPVAVIGCGRMGRFHARVYSQLAGVKLVGVYDANGERAAAVAAEFETRAAGSVEELLPQVAAVSIAAPTSLHESAAGPFLARGIACLIEKPLAHDLASARRIIEMARSGGAIVQVGHIERFNPALLAMERLNISPRFMEVVRISPMTFRSIDVGVVLDIMIHDLDIVLKLAGSPVESFDAVGVSVIGKVEDLCNVRLRFENGCAANLTASRLALKTERRLRVFSHDAYVSLDYQKRQGVIVHRGGNLEAIRQAVEDIRAGRIEDVSQLNFAELVKMEQLEIDDVEPLRAQLEAFAAAVANKTPPPVTAEDGLAALELAQRIIERIAPGMDL